MLREENQQVLTEKTPQIIERDSRGNTSNLSALRNSVPGKPTRSSISIGLCINHPIPKVVQNLTCYQCHCFRCIYPMQDQSGQDSCGRGLLGSVHTSNLNLLGVLPMATPMTVQINRASTPNFLVCLLNQLSCCCCSFGCRSL